jgi:hypothetical protein
MKTIKFLVATDPAQYGPDATPQDAQEFAAFAYQYLQKQGYEEVEVEFVDKYPQDGADMQGDLRKQIWSAFRG